MACQRLRALAVLLLVANSHAADPAFPQGLIGYTELRTNVPGGRHANVSTMRAAVVKVDGSGRRLLANELANKANTWTQFAGWSPDGKTAIVGRGWQSPENAKWEEEHKQFRFTKEGWLLDSYLVDVATGKAENLTAVERISFYNGGVFFWPNDPAKLGFTALIDGNSHPFRMDRDGRNKTDLTKASKEFAYGFSSSRDGKRIAYHKNYQVYLADADGSNAHRVETGKPFNFAPWSPDGNWVLFVSGEHYNCHPHIVRADGTGLRKLADRNGYRGVIEFLDVADFHGGSSDTPVWSADGQSVFFTAQAGKNVELFRIALDGKPEQLTKSAEGTLHYHPQPSADGKWLAYGSKRDGVRQLFVMRLADRREQQITQLKPGHGAMWPHWQPAIVDKKDSLPRKQPVGDKAPIAHWPLAGDGKDTSGNGHHAINRGVDLKAIGPDGKPGSAAQFDGRGAHLEVPAANKPSPGKGDFSLALWVHTEPELDDVPGDIASLYDPARRRGFHLTIKSSAVTTSQANTRHLQFSIDNGKESSWTDCGRPGKAILAFALAAHDGDLYAGTCEPGKTDSGRVYRYAGEKRWIDCGAPASCNSVTALAVHEGKLYAGVGKYRLAGSALAESENLNLGGGVFRYEGDSKWIDCGRLPSTEAIGGFVVYRGKLYASSLYKPAGFYRYDGATKWTDCGTPNGKRVEALVVYDGFLYGSSYDGGRVYRYDGKTWTDCGQLGDNTQTYSFAVYHGRLYVGTWPSGRVYRFEDIGRWKDVGRLGDENEVMGMLVHNGRLLAGTLPLAEVYQYEADDRWKKLAGLDQTPDVKYRRAWTAAEHQGRVYFSTLPSGHIYAFEAGKSAAWEHELAAGWHHVAAVKRAGRLELFLDGKHVAVSTPFEPAGYDLTTDSPLRIGAGATDFFRGRLRDVRLYHRSLSEAEVRALARP